ncbi:MAG TPA: acyl-CoA dehydrogenase family protein [Terriglobales bacterium]|nr:acyl-CoA dehydrogenase family protein [Terriglobales bacterium]
MSYPLPPRAREMRDAARRFVEQELSPWEVHAEMHEGLIPDEIKARHQKLAREIGLNAMDIPVAEGGTGLTMLEQVAVTEEIGRVTNALGWCYSNAQKWMLKACSPYQIETWIRRLISGEGHECYAITEADAGSDVDAIKATARRDGDHYVLNGEKWHVTSGNLADVMIFQAKLSDGPNAGAHCLFFVPMETPGISILRNPAYSHTYAAHHPIYALKDVRVPAANRIGEEGAGMGFTYDWFRYERLMIAARCCGAAARLIDEATKFAQERVVFGQKLADQQLIQAMLADSVTELWAARLITFRTAEEIDAGADVKVTHAQSSMAKLYASEMANRVADRAVQIFGGRGYMRENVAERFFRELRVDRIWEGTSEIQRLIIANGLYKRGQDALID